MMYRALLALMLLVPSLWVHAEQNQLNLVASVRPISLLMQELTLGLPASTTTLMPKGATPHDYVLKPSDLKALRGAELVVWLGPNAEHYLKKAVTKAPRVLTWEALEGVTKLPLRDAMHHHHHHGHDDHHEHMDAHDEAHSWDPHLWMSTANALVLLEAMQAQLVALRPQWQAQLETNSGKIQQRLQQQLTQMQVLLNADPQPFILAHDAYHYLEADLNIHSVATVVLDPEIKPGAKHIMAVKQRVKKDGVACVVTDPAVSSDLLAKIDSQSTLTQVAIDPLAWDFDGNEYSLWLSSMYVKMMLCVVKD